MSLDSARRDMTTLLFDKAYQIRTEEDWKGIEDYATRWFAALKVEETYETFNDAFKDNRMTIRAILQTRQAGHYKEKVPIKGIESEGGKREIKTMQGIPGVQARMNDANLFGQGKDSRQKYEQGLFDVSAILLDGSRTLKLGGEGPTDKNQMYRTTGDTIYVFMPVTRQEDMVVFSMLSVQAKYQQPGSPGLKMFVQYMKSRLTRIKLAFEGDAGCKFLDFAPEGDLQPKFRYGFGKIMKANAPPEEVRRRKIDANLYKSVLLGTNRNEIVLAYRQHGTRASGSSFPIYAKGVFAPNDISKTGACGACGTQKGFVVITAAGVATNDIIDLKGLMRPGTANDLGGFMTRAGGCECKPS